MSRSSLSFPGLVGGLLLALSVAGRGLPTARAESVPTPAPGPTLEQELGALPSPAEEAQVHALVSRALAADAPVVDRVARALAFAGGPAAARGLEALLAHREETARIAVLGATVALDLRCEHLVEAIRRIAREARGQEREAAVHALGFVGDGRDVDLLLRRAGEGTGPERVVAYRALTQLTGASIPYVQARWTYYWKTFRMRATLMLPQTLMAITMAPSEPDTESLLALVRRYGWVDLPSVRDAVSAWLVAPEQELRTIACLLAAELRLGDLVPDLEHALLYAHDERLAEEARKAVQTLGGRP